MKTFLLIALSGLLAACAGKTSPAWQSNAHVAINNHMAAYLEGRERVATQELLLARREVARTGDATQMARVELSACAAQIASLAATDCPAFTPLASDAAPPEKAYAAYLAGKTAGLDGSLGVDLWYPAIEPADDDVQVAPAQRRIERIVSGGK